MGKHLLQLHDVAFCEDFACNIISFRKLKRKGIWWDTVKVSGLVRLFITEYKGKQREDLHSIRVLSGNQYAFTI